MRIRVGRFICFIGYSHRPNKKTTPKDGLSKNMIVLLIEVQAVLSGEILGRIRAKR